MLMHTMDLHKATQLTRGAGNSTHRAWSGLRGTPGAPAPLLCAAGEAKPSASDASLLGAGESMKTLHVQRPRPLLRLTLAAGRAVAEQGSRTPPFHRVEIGSMPARVSHTTYGATTFKDRILPARSL